MALEAGAESTGRAARWLFDSILSVTGAGELKTPLMLFVFGLVAWEVLLPWLLTIWVPHDLELLRGTLVSIVAIFSYILVMNGGFWLIQSLSSMIRPPLAKGLLSIVFYMAGIYFVLWWAERAPSSFKTMARTLTLAGFLSLLTGFATLKAISWITKLMIDLVVPVVGALKGFEAAKSISLGMEEYFYHPLIRPVLSVAGAIALPVLALKLVRFLSNLV